MVLSEYARLRAINWLNGMQSSGAFDGFDEENMDFESLSNEDIRYYFIEWYFTEPDEEVEDEPELILERQRILFSEQDSKRLYGLYDLQLKGLKAQYVADSYDDMVEQGADRVVTYSEDDEEEWENYSDDEICFNDGYMPIEITEEEYDKVSDSDEIGMCTVVSGLDIDVQRVEVAYQKMKERIKSKVES